MKIPQQWLRCLAVCLVLVKCLTTELMAEEHDTPARDQGPDRPSNESPARVLDAWTALQIRLMSSMPASFNGPFIRIYAYSGIAAYASIRPSTDGGTYAFVLDRLQDFPALPVPEKDKTCHWPASLNAALAFMNRVMFPMASEKNKNSIQALEDSIRKACVAEAGEESVDNAARYGLLLSRMIYEWAEKDGYKKSGEPYTLAAARGTWMPTAPGYAPAVTPHWGVFAPSFPAVLNTQTLLLHPCIRGSPDLISIPWCRKYTGNQRS